MNSLKFIGAIFSAFTFGCSPSLKENANQGIPIKNVVFILGDDHATGVLGCYGNKIVRTPNLDQLASEGVLFTNAFANAPMCSASRQSILTGRYPHAAGVTLLRTSFPDEQYTIAEHLKKYNFRTEIIGKHHFNNDLPHGFDQVISRNEWRQEMETKTPRIIPDSIKIRPPWKPFQDHARIWLNSETLPGPYYDQDSYTSFFTRKACEFIEQNKDQRFCLWLAYNEPHSPFNFPIDFEGKYRPEDMPLPQGSPEDDQWIPKVFSDLTESEKRGIIASYYTSVEYLDRNIGVVLDKLKSSGLDKNTLVIYVGDHGYLLNDHKRFEKHMMWEEAVGSPLIVRIGSPKIANRISSVLTEFVDLVPTILDLLKIDPMPGLQGRSLVPVLTQGQEDHKEYVFSEFLVDNKAMVRSKDWKYIYSSGKRDLGQGYATGNPPTGPIHRLYDLRNDPKETSNVSDDPANKEILTRLQDEMIRTFTDTHPKVDKLPPGLSKEEMLIWFCQPPEGEDVGAK